MNTGLLLKTRTEMNTIHIYAFNTGDFFSHQSKWHLSVHPFRPSVCLSALSYKYSYCHIRIVTVSSVHPSIYLSVSMDGSMYVRKNVVLSVSLPVCLSVYRFVCLSFCPSMCASINLFTCLSVCLTLRFYACMYVR